MVSWCSPAVRRWNRPAGEGRRVRTTGLPREKGLTLRDPPDRPPAPSPPREATFFAEGTVSSNLVCSSGESTNFWFLKLRNRNGDDCLVATNRSARFRSAGRANEVLLPTREAWKFHGLGRDARLAALANVGMENRVQSHLWVKGQGNGGVLAGGCRCLVACS